MLRKSIHALWLAVVGAYLSSPTAGETVQYWVDVDNTWSEETHPGLFPTDAHFSWFGGGVHNSNASFWQEGQLASRGFVRMAETGVTTLLFREVNAQVEAGNALVGYDIQHWFCPSGTNHSSCGESRMLIRASDEFSLVTLVSMLGPSPDWFVGTSGLDLKNESGWQDEIAVDLRPYDGGTRSDNVWLLGGPVNDPPEPIHLITAESGQLVGPDSLGTMTFRRVAEGDFDASGQIDSVDIDRLSTEIRASSGDLLFDLNQDSHVDEQDRSEWVHRIAKTWYGDSNLNGTFATDDLIQVFQAGKYEDQVASNAGWADGDWNGDSEFDSSDLVIALSDGGFLAGQAAQVQNVPEPTGGCLAAIGLSLFSVKFRRVRLSR